MEKQEFKQMLDERDEKFKGILTQALADTSRDLRDFTRQEISASETRIKTEIIDAVAESLDISVHPRFKDHERRLLKLEAKIA
jgi:hypothetical protein